MCGTQVRFIAGDVDAPSLNPVSLRGDSRCHPSGAILFIRAEVRYVTVSKGGGHGVCVIVVR